MREVGREHALASIFCFLAGVLAIVGALCFTGCKTPNIPAIHAKFWAGDSKNDSITRSQDHDSLLCRDIQFDNYVCLTYEDLKKIYDTMLTCKEWGPPIINEAQTLAFIRSNPEVARHVTEKRQLEPLYP